MECPRCHVPALPADPACSGCLAPLVLPDDAPLSRLDLPLEIDRRLVDDAAWPEPQTAPAPVPGEPGPRALAAAAIDAAVSLAVAAPSLALAAWMLPAGADRLGALGWPGAGLFALLSFAHATLGHALMGATVGERLLGLCVTAADGLPPRLGRAALRAALALLGLVLLRPLFTHGRRTLHDQIAGTWTVRAP